MALVYLNGAFVPAEQACVPVMDRGFIFGDGIYELIPAYGGRLFRFDEHMSRLKDSLDAIRIPNPMDNDRWRAILTQVMAQNTDKDQSVYLQVTRGVAKRDHAIPVGMTPTVFVMANVMHHPDQAQIEHGVEAISCEDIRWKLCHIKAVSLLANVLLRQQAVDVGAIEAILIRDGLVTEGAASNVFIVKQGRLITPPKGPNLLPGITRDLILELAKKNQIPCQESQITTVQLKEADEVWLTSSLKEILAVTTLDSMPIGDGKPGEVWAKMYQIYQQYKQDLRRGP